MSKQSEGRYLFVEHSLREVREGQVLKLAGSRFAVLAKERRRRLVHLDLKAEDGGRATLIGVPGARVTLRERKGKRPVADPQDRHAIPGTAADAAIDGRSTRNVGP